MRNNDGPKKKRNEKRDVIFIAEHAKCKADTYTTPKLASINFCISVAGSLFEFAFAQSGRVKINFWHLQ